MGHTRASSSTGEADSHFGFSFSHWKNDRLRGAIQSGAVPALGKDNAIKGKHLFLPF